jgi:hypothetical protein
MLHSLKPLSVVETTSGWAQANCMRQLIRAEEKPLLIGEVVPLLPLRKHQMQEAIALDVQRPTSGLYLSRYMTTCRSQP